MDTSTSATKEVQRNHYKILLNKKKSMSEAFLEKMNYTKNTDNTKNPLAPQSIKLTSETTLDRQRSLNV